MEEKLTLDRVRLRSKDKSFSVLMLVNKLLGRMTEEDYEVDVSTKRLAESIVHSYLDSQITQRLNALVIFAPDVIRILNHLVYTALKTQQNITKNQLELYIQGEDKLNDNEVSV